MDEETIVQKIKNGELTRDTDEKYAEGFWDMAGDFAGDIYPNDDQKFEQLQQELYDTFWAIVESMEATK